MTHQDAPVAILHGGDGKFHYAPKSDIHTYIGIKKVSSVNLSVSQCKESTYNTNRYRSVMNYDANTVHLSDIKHGTCIVQYATLQEHLFFP